jgi:hypothetical protein
VTIYVPEQYVQDVHIAARMSGLPLAVVIAQINDESRFDPNAVSDEGAEGIAQFEPGTWASWGTGSPFNPADAFPAYAAFMHYLLHLFNGDIRDALAAYNAGPGDVPAGYGYADSILSAAGLGWAVTAGTGTDTRGPEVVSRIDEARIDGVIREIAESSRRLVGLRMAIRNTGMQPNAR